MAFRKKLYTSLDEIQKDLDAFMDDYNTKRTNQGKHCQGRTPMEMFLAGAPIMTGGCPSRSRSRRPDRDFPGGPICQRKS